MSNLEKTYSNSKYLPFTLPFPHRSLKNRTYAQFTGKTLARQAKKAQKDENTEKARLKKALQQGNNDGTRIYASNAIRKKSESLNLLCLASRLDAVAS
ncbi:hypothetical protein V8E53_004948 [Lactarius tabidus]